jgi:hypothetical protein
MTTDAGLEERKLLGRVETATERLLEKLRAIEALEDHTLTHEHKAAKIKDAVRGFVKRMHMLDVASPKMWWDPESYVFCRAPFRKVWFEERLDGEWKESGMVEAWAWAAGETDYLMPMTKPPWTEGQQAWVTCELIQHCDEFEQLVVEVGALRQLARERLGSEAETSLDRQMRDGKLTIDEMRRLVYGADQGSLFEGDAA